MIYLDSNSRRFCRDAINCVENYEKAVNDKSKTWVLHHRLELTIDGLFALSRDDLKRMGMYYHRPAFELIFLDKSQHMRMHMRALNPNRLASVRYKKSIKMMGNKNPLGIIRDEAYRDKFRGDKNPAKRPEVREKISKRLKELFANESH